MALWSARAFSRSVTADSTSSSAALAAATAFSTALCADLIPTLPLLTAVVASSSANVMPSTFFFCMRSLSPPAFMICSCRFLHLASTASDLTRAFSSSPSVSLSFFCKSFTAPTFSGLALTSASKTLRLSRVSASSLTSASSSISSLFATLLSCWHSRSHCSTARSSCCTLVRVAVSSSLCAASFFSSESNSLTDRPSTSSDIFEDMPPRDTLLPPPDIVPEVSITEPSSVTTRKRCFP
mmetsp:Transcript_42415/g.62378  ORF Transcript_42415/g.62378 Transcript_42415/m.62378 type:complete len:239 (+) Transcript_42415:1524-2240(+)